MYKYSNVFKVFKCSNVEIFKYSNIQILDIQIFKCTNIKMFKCLNIQMFKGGEPYVFNYKTPELEKCLQEMIEVNK